MIKCFLSHSSIDKERYVRIVIRHLRKEVRVFDEETFEKGMGPIEEIINGLDESSLFVIFLSDTALNSDWVKHELSNAKQYLDEGRLQRIYPILIDEDLTHTDDRIPEWLKESTNIQHIVRPAVAAKKINSRLIEISWNFHPRLRERETIFVGRNSLINEIEERLDDFRKSPPSVLIASGLPYIGRKSFLKYASRKSNLVRDSYEYPLITLAQSDSIEDFILKIHDLGFSDTTNLHDKLRGNLQQKIQVAGDIIKQIINESERILIEDNGVIVQRDGEIVDWLVDVVRAIESAGHLTFCVASKLRPNKSINHKNESFYCVYVEELQPSEREGLLVRYSKFKELSLNREDLGFFSDLLTGYPEQVIYAVDLVDDAGIFYAKKRSHEIQEYSSDKAKIILEKFSSRPDVTDFIFLLSKFEFMSYELIFSIVAEDAHAELLDELLVSSVCERIGSNGEYVRVNEVIRDYISRGRFGIPKKFQKAISSHVNDYLINYSDENADLSDYLFSVQEAVLSGASVPEELLIPSILIKTIKKLYDEDRNYKDAMRLCDRVLQQESTIHRNSVDHVRFIKCQCLARLTNRDFFGEVQSVAEPEKSFLMGFYYRIAGQYGKALEYFQRVLRKRPNDVRTKGELVRVYMQIEEYDKAFEMAKSNYMDRPGNPININNYFTCLIHKEKTPENRIELDAVFYKLDIDPSDQAQEMAISAKSRLLAFYDHDYERAFEEIEKAIDRFTNNNFPLLTKADLAVYARDIKKLREAIASLEASLSRRAQTYRTFQRYKACLIALEGDADSARRFIMKELKGLGENASNRLIHKVEELANP
ncbi:MAG: TIR domain-containing protein [Sedimenticola sp.]